VRPILISSKPDSSNAPSTYAFDRGCYPCAVKGSHWPYADDAFAFLAVYILPEDLWYTIPKSVLGGQASVALRPAVQNSKYPKYLGAWGLMKRSWRLFPTPPQLKFNHAKY